MLLFLLCLCLIVNVQGKCSSENCVHGQCHGKKCVCSAGVTGKRCDTDIIDCDQDACLNNGRCIELLNGFRCKCQTGFAGLRCQHRSCSSCDTPDSYYPRNCSTLKFRIDNHETSCVATGTLSLMDIDCQCDFDEKDKRWITCQLIPQSSWKDRCVFRKSVASLSSSVFSSLPDRISIYVCPVNGQSLSRSDVHSDLITSVHMKRCLLSVKK